MEKGNSKLHFADRWIGIVIVFILGFFKIKHRITIPFNPKRISVLNISSIGDTVLMSAIIKDIKSAYPNSEIWIFTGKTNHAIAHHIPFVHKIVRVSIKNPLKAIRTLNGFGKFDLLLDMGPWPRLNSIYSFFINAKIKIGFNSEGQYRHYIYDYPILHSDKKHEIDNFRALLEPLKIKATHNPELLHLTNNLKAKFNIEKEYIVIHPWPGGYKSYMKEWAIEKWVDLMTKMDLLKYDIVITGGKADIDKTLLLINACASKGIEIINMAGELSISDTIELLSKSKYIISVNTGIMHIGAALNKPLIGIHGPTSVLRWGPVSDKAISVAANSEFCGYLHLGFEYNKSKIDCMAIISVQDVFEAFKKIENKYN